MKCKTCGGGRSFKKTVDGHITTVNCPICDGTGEVEDPPSAPTLADVVALLERQAKTCERIAKTLDKIAFIAKDL